MDHKAQLRRLDGRIAALAARQFGVVSRPQLLELGATGDQIAFRMQRGRLHRVHRGVHLVGHAARTRRAVELGAVLAAGAGAVLSHSSAAYFWALLPYPAQTRDVHVTLPGRKRRRRPGLIVHSHPLPRFEYRIRDGIPVTQVPRTLLDLAAQALRHELETAVNEAYALRLCARPQLDSVIARHPRHAGTAALAEAAGLRMTRSAAERRLLRAILASDLSAPDTNVMVAGYEVNFLWRAHGLVVEVDAWPTHGSRSAFERDRYRDARLAARGLRVIRLTADSRPSRALETIRAGLRPTRTADTA